MYLWAPAPRSDRRRRAVAPGGARGHHARAGATAPGRVRGPPVGCASMCPSATTADFTTSWRGRLRSSRTEHRGLRAWEP